jgi:hypothetical protein
LEKLSYADGAPFNSQHWDDERQRLIFEPDCLPNTRRGVLEEIQVWAEGRQDRHECICWLNGMAGTGKSTIARTAAREFHRRNWLGASFFFRSKGDLSNALKFFSTIARQLARFSTALKESICTAIAGLQGGEVMEDQWTQLIFQPLSQLKLGSVFTPVVIVIDALDECKDEVSITRILGLLKKANDLSNVQLRILISSRPESHIRRGLDEASVYKNLDLHKIPSDTIENDIFVFFKFKLDEIKTQKGGLDPNWPSKDQYTHLVQRAGGLFIYAATVCRFIGAKNAPSTKRLDLILNGQPGQKATQELDEMYSKILKYDLEELDEEEIATFFKNFRHVLGFVILLFDSLSANALKEVCDMKIEDVYTTVNPLRSVLDVPDSRDGPIRLFHDSFGEFLLSEQRCKDVNLQIDKSQTHVNLGESCLRLMSKLSRNICSLPTPGTLAVRVDRSEIAKRLPSYLQYACRYWVDHLHQLDNRQREKSGLYDKVHVFLQEHFLHWLEALGLIGKMSEGVLIMKGLQSMINVGVPA